MEPQDSGTEEEIKVIRKGFRMKNKIIVSILLLVLFVASVPTPSFVAGLEGMEEEDTYENLHIESQESDLERLSTEMGSDAKDRDGFLGEYVENDSKYAAAEAFETGLEEDELVIPEDNDETEEAELQKDELETSRFADEEEADFSVNTEPSKEFEFSEEELEIVAQEKSNAEGTGKELVQNGSEIEVEKGASDQSEHDVQIHNALDIPDEVEGMLEVATEESDSLGSDLEESEDISTIEQVHELAEETIIDTSDVDLPNSDVLLAEYIERITEDVTGKEVDLDVDDSELEEFEYKAWQNDVLFDRESHFSVLSEGSVTTAAGTTGGEILDENEMRLYNILKEKVSQVAKGTLSSAEFYIEFSDIYGREMKTEFNVDEYSGVDSFGVISGQSATLNEAGKRVIAEEYADLNVSLVVKSLMYNIPCEMYWYDKVTPMSYSSSPSYGCSSIDGSSIYKITASGNFHLTMKVSANYSSNRGQGTSDTDTSKTNSAYNTAQTAASVVQSQKGNTDYQTLQNYKKWICDQVEYDTSAVSNSNTPYGDPWQLISVFDNKNETNVVCEGYSKAFKYLCDLTTFDDQRIDCYLVSGDMNGGTGAGAHMWNVVTMDDGYNYLVDVTNCDGNSVGNPDYLFLKGYTSFLANSTKSSDGYIISFTNSGNTYSISYRYHTSDDTGHSPMEVLYNESILAIANRNYTETEKENLSGANITLSETEYTYDGTAKEPIVTKVELNGNELTVSDYDVTYENNTHAGTAKVKVSGKGNYTGRTTRDFIIKKATWGFNASVEKTALTVGETVQISVTGADSDGVFQYQSSASSVATVGDNGLITALAAGSTTIAVSRAGDDNHETCETNIEITVSVVEIEYTISYILNDGIDSGNPNSYTTNTPTFTLMNPTRSGYTFTGWTGTGIESAQTVVTIEGGSTGNRTFTANWKANTYTVTLNMNGGTGISNTITVTYDTLYPDIADPSRTGYEFKGWFLGDNYVTQVTANTIVRTAGEHHLYAKWSAISYKISYTLNEGEAEGNPNEYTIETDTFTLTNPIKAGYVFEGWTGTGLSETTITVTIAKGTTENRAYTAHWKASTYRLTLVANGGHFDSPSDTTKIVDVTYDDEYGMLATPTKENYIFKGWFTEETGGTEVTASVIVKKTENHMLYAHWEEETAYSITYDLNGGVNHNDNPASYTSSQSIVLKAPSKTGYTFKGWTGSNGNAPSKNVTIDAGSTGSKTYTANWEANKYTVTLNAKGGTGAGESIQVTYDGEYDSLTTPTKDGYTFEGWFTEETGGTEVTSNTKVQTAENHTLYARWNAVEYKITYNLNNGEVRTSNPSKYTVETEEFTLNNPTREGYAFKGWTGTDLSGQMM